MKSTNNCVIVWYKYVWSEDFLSAIKDIWFLILMSCHRYQNQITFTWFDCFACAIPLKRVGIRHKKGKFQAHCLEVSRFYANCLNSFVFINDSNEPLHTEFAFWIPLFVIFHFMIRFEARRLKNTQIYAHKHTHRTHIQTHVLCKCTRVLFACNFYT